MISTGVAYLFNFYIFLYSVSYTGLILTTVYLLLNLYFNLRTKESRLEKILIMCVFPVCALLSVIGPVAVKGRMFDILNKMMNTRWNLSRYFLTHQPITLFGGRMTDLPDTSYSIDCSYVYALMYYGIVLFVLLCAAYFLTVRYEVKTEKRRELAIMLSFFIAGMSEPFMANLSFKNLTLLFIGEYYYQAVPFWQRGIVGRIAGKKIRMTPWTEKEMNIALPEWNGLHDMPVYIKGKRLKIVAAGIAAALLAGSIYYYTAEPAECVYADTGLSDYWSGETVYLDATELPDDWNGIIVGSADGNTEMYVLTGNIVWLEQVRESVSVGLGAGILVVIVTGLGVAWLGSRNTEGKKKGR